VEPRGGSTRGGRSRASALDLRRARRPSEIGFERIKPGNEARVSAFEFGLPPAPRRLRRKDPALSVSFFLDRPLSRGDGLEALVRNGLAALDREPVGPGGKAGLRAVDRSQLFL
jgi:hypothetical protein